MAEMYLETHPPRRSQSGPRGRTASGVIVLHSAENVPDTIGPDSGAEGVAAFIAGRTTPGSYHRLVDSDTIVPLIRFPLAAWGDGTGSNSHAIHLSVATQAHRWGTLPREWKVGALLNLARAAHEASDYIDSVHGIRIPSRRITVAESNKPGEGFITHAERDPGRRSDPRFGPWEWETFLDFYRDLEAPQEAPKPVPADPTRGPNVDLALKRISRARADLEAAKGSGKRGDAIAFAEQSLAEAQRALRSVNIIDKQEA